MKRPAILAAVLLLGAGAAGVLSGGCSDSSSHSSSTSPGTPQLNLTIDPLAFDEGSAEQLTLKAQGIGEDMKSFLWGQTAGPLVPLLSKSAEQATVLVGDLQVAVDTELEFELTIDYGDVQTAARARTTVRAVDAVALLGEDVQLGGAVRAAAVFTAQDGPWLLHGSGNRLAALQLPAAPQPPAVGIVQGPAQAGWVAEKGGGCEIDPFGEKGPPLTGAVHQHLFGVCLFQPWTGIAGMTQGPPAAAPFAVRGEEPPAALHLPGVVRDIEVVRYDGRDVALVALGREGIAAVELSGGLKLLHTTRVGHLQRQVTWTTPDGKVVFDNELASDRAEVVALESDGETLFLANADFGIQRTPLRHVLGDGQPLLADDGTLRIEAGVFTLHFAGEEPWGGPKDLLLRQGRLFAALGLRGVGVFDAGTLEGVGHYNLYADASVTEDWFVARDPALEAQPGGVDPLTGLPTPLQASYEIQLGSLPQPPQPIGAPTPWIDLATAGKHYYDARAIDVVDYGERSIAYVAYGLAGLVALDVTRYATAHGPQAYLVPTYLGYVPAVPGPGPRAAVGPLAARLLPQDDADALACAGVNDVAVRDGVLWYADFHAGLVALAGAAAPERLWRDGQRYYDNDDPTLGAGLLGDHQPPWEWVTSYDLACYDPHEPGSLPAWMEDGMPCLAVSGSLEGTGEGVVLLPGYDADVALLCGAQGLALFDGQLSAYAWRAMDLERVGQLPTTDAIGAGANDGAGWKASLGASLGVQGTDQHVYVADDRNGVQAWRVVDAAGWPSSTPALVGNTLPGAEPQPGSGGLVHPADHACALALDGATGELFALCNERGLRRMAVGALEATGPAPAEPLLLQVGAGDVFQHDPDELANEALGVALHGTYAFVADGRSGLSAYDLTRRPRYSLVGRAGDLGVARAVDLWAQGDFGTYALVAAGPMGLAVVNVTDPEAPVLERFAAPEVGQTVDVAVAGELAWISHQPGGVYLYDTHALAHAGVDQPLARWRLQDESGYGDATALPHGISLSQAGGRTTLLVAYGEAGCALVDWTDPDAPALLRVAPTAGSCRDVTVSGGRVFAADRDGGLAAFQ